MNPLQLTFGGVPLHELGIVSVLSQSSAFSPEQFPQSETRQISCRVDCWENDTGYNYDLLYARIQSLRTALRAQNQVLTWISPGDTSPGDTLLDRPVIVVSHDLPEDSNGWGIYHQQINIVFKYEVDTSSESTTLKALATGSAGVPVAIQLGQVHTWKDDYQNSFYSEWRNNRRRSQGNITCSGEIVRGLGETGNGVDVDDTRIALLVADLTNIRTQLQSGKYITLQYGPSDNRMFNRDVKVENFSADIDQGPLVGKIKWSLTVSYTLFPDEAAYAAAEFQSVRSQDMESGREILGINGRVVAATEALAVSKLATVIASILAGAGFSASSQTRKEVSKAWVNADDTQGENTTNDNIAITNTAFFELSFNYAYDRKQANILSYTLTISDNDDLKSGLLTRTYSGSVMASGASETAAYNAALAQARTLGDQKHPFRVSSVEARNDRKLVGQSAAEFITLTFSYTYQLKGTRVFLDLGTSVNADTFGESTERVSGYVVAGTLTDANAQYQTLVRSLYNGRLIRNESLDEREETVQLGSPWYSGSGFSTMPIRLDFSLSVFKAKDAGSFAIKHAVRVSQDFVGLSQRTSVSGQFVGDPVYLAAIEAGTDNPLDTFIDSIAASYGNLEAKEFVLDKEKVGTGDAQTIIVNFNCQFGKVLTGEAQVVSCNLREEIVYSGTRNVFQQLPDGADRHQSCGTTQGSRTVSGTVSAATEDAAMAWVEKQRGANGLYTNWRDTKPADDARFEEPISLNKTFTFMPLTDGNARGDSVNVQIITIEFSFREIVPSLPSPF